MAITIEYNPRDYSAVYNRMDYLISSTNSGNTDFSYIVDVYINGSVTKTARLRIPLRPSDSKGVVDIHRILEPTITSDVGAPKSTAGSLDTVNSHLKYIVKFGEEYDVSGTLTQFPDLTVDTSRDAINASPNKQEFVDWDFLTVHDMQGTSNKFITNAPDNHVVSIDGHGWLYFKERTTITYYEIQTYNAAGGTISNFRIDPTATSGTIQYIPSSPESLNGIGAGFFLAGAQPIIIDTVASYTIFLFGGGVISETRTFVIKEPCKFNSNTLIFQNKLGMFDDFTFYNGDSHSFNSVKKDMKVNVDNVSGSSIVYSMSEREKVTFYTKSSETIKLMSDWITEDEDAWLLELIESPEIYLQNGDDLIAVSKIKATSHTKRKHVRDKLFMLEVEIELGYDNYRQRG